MLEISDIFPNSAVDVVKRAGGSKIEIYDDEDTILYNKGKNRKYNYVLSFRLPLKNLEDNVASMREKLGEEYQLFATESTVEGKIDIGYGIVKSDFYFEPLWSLATNGCIHDLQTEDIVEKLSLWKEKYDIELKAVNFDWIYITFNKLPENMLEFAKEVIEFCPDMDAEGRGIDVAAPYVAEVISEKRDLYLWWD